MMANTAELRAARSARIAAVIRSVCADALRATRARGITVLEDWTPEGELLYEWLVHELGESRVWRAAAAGRNMHEAADWRSAPADAPLLAHPANKTALLLGGRPPLADLLPLGDLWASQVDELIGRWSAPPAVEKLAEDTGGISALDLALRRMTEERWEIDHACADLSGEAAARLGCLFERGRHARRYPRLVPKLSARTLGVDLFD